MNMLAPYLRKTFCAPVLFVAPTPIFPSAFASLTMAISCSCGSNGERFTISTRLSEQEANTCVSSGDLCGFADRVCVVGGSEVRVAGSTPRGLSSATHAELPR